MKNLLTVTAFFESVTGLVLIAFPGILTTLLFGSVTNVPVALTVARVAGVAIFALAVACWLARNDGQSFAAKGLAGAMLLYNTAIAITLVYAAFGLALSGIGLWPVVLTHVALAVWCIMSLLIKQNRKKS